MMRAPQAVGWLALLLLVCAGVWNALGEGGGGTLAASAPAQGGAPPEVLVREPRELPVPRESEPQAVLPAAPVRDVEPAASPAPAVPHFAELVQALLEVEAREALDFHHAALEVMQPWWERDPEQRPALVQEAWSLLEHDAYSPPVLGCLLSVLGAWGEQAEVLARSGGRGEAWRSALLGLGCAASVAGRGAGVSIDPLEVLRMSGAEESGQLQLSLVRIPDEALDAQLFGLLDRVALDLDQLQDRRLALLALGPGVDTRIGTLEYCTRLLFDPTAHGLQVRLETIYVLSRSSSDAAHEALLQYLADDQADAYGKAQARWWLGDRASLGSELEVLSRPLHDEDAPMIDRMSAVGAVLKRLEVADEAELARIEDLLVEVVGESDDSTLHLALVSALATANGGRPRLAALGRVLVDCRDRACRLWAARGLARPGLGDPLEARGYLQMALLRESEANVRAEIEAGLAGLP